MQYIHDRWMIVSARNKHDRESERHPDEQREAADQTAGAALLRGTGIGFSHHRGILAGLSTRS
jgi:hypothetical protein